MGREHRPTARRAGWVRSAAVRPAWVRRLRRHRRWAASVLLGLAVAVAVRAAAPAQADGTLVTAAADLPAGHVLAAGDLVSTAVARSAVPAGALPARALEGARLASPVRAGEAVTDVRVAGPGLTRALPDGEVAVPVLLPAQVRPWLAVGQRVRLQAAADPTTLDPAAVDLGGPATTATAVVLDVAPADGGGLLGAGGGEAVPVLVQVPGADADALASATEVRAVLVGGP